MVLALWSANCHILGSQVFAACGPRGISTARSGGAYSLNLEGESHTFSAIVRRNQIAILGCLLVLLAASLGWDFYASDLRSAIGWNSTAISATYVGAQLREIQPDQASLFLAYELKNNTDTDYHLSDGPGFVVMSRLDQDGSLSSQEQTRLSYPALVPGGQSVRIAIEIQHPFGWPADNDPQLQQKLKAFVNQRVAGVREFVIFDQPDRVQVTLPGGWQQMKVAAASLGTEKFEK